MVSSYGVVFIVFTRGGNMNVPLESYSQHRKSNLSESSDFTSCDVLADVFRNDGALARAGPKVNVDKFLI